MDAGPAAPSPAPSPAAAATIDGRARPGTSSPLTPSSVSTAHLSPRAPVHPDLLAQLPRTPLPPPRAGRPSRTSAAAAAAAAAVAANPASPSSPPRTPGRRKSRSFSTWSVATSASRPPAPVWSYSGASPWSPPSPSGPAVGDWDVTSHDPAPVDPLQPLTDPVLAPPSNRMSHLSLAPDAAEQSSLSVSRSGSLPGSLLGPASPSEARVPSPSIRSEFPDPDGGPAALQDLSHSPPSPHRSSVPSTALSEPDVDVLARAEREALRAWDEDPTFMPREEIVLWLGRPCTAVLSEAEVSAAQAAYMGHFDFKKDRIDEALRKLCAKLLVRAETQVLDRVLRAFAARFSAAHPWGLYRSEDLIHHLAYSILLLNTDLHVADLGERMTRSQFVKNTLLSLEDDSGSSPLASTDEARSDADARRTSSIEGVQRESRTDGPDQDQVWVTSMERLLKDIYSSVRSEPIHQPAWSGEVLGSPWAPSSSAVRARDSRRTSIRGLPSLLTPGASAPMRRRPESASGLDSRSSTRPSAPVGFVTSLNRTMIPEEHDGDARPSGATGAASYGPSCTSQAVGSTDAIHDAELALVGPPWAKEGRLGRKLREPKRTKDKMWLEVFAVVHAPGVLSLFRFAPSSKGGDGQAVGGGNWALSAEQIDEIGLQHALAQAVPPPGLSRSRPHVVALHLPDYAAGNMYLHTAHEGLVSEWCSTINYWAARASVAPLAAGVTSVDYGWSFGAPTSASTGTTPSPPHPTAPSREEDSRNLLHPPLSVPGPGASGSSRGGALSLSVSDSGSSASLLGLVRASTVQAEEEDALSMARSHSTGGTSTASSTPSRRGLAGWSKALRGLGSRVASDTAGPVDFTAVAPGGKSTAGRGAGAGVGQARRTPSPALGPQVHMGSKVPAHERVVLGTWAAPPPPPGRSVLDAAAQEKTICEVVGALEAELAAHQGVHGPLQARFHPRGANAAHARANWDRKLDHLLDELAKYRTYAKALLDARDKQARLVRRDGLIVDPAEDE